MLDKKEKNVKKERELEYEECLTNEQLLKRFKNQFELVRYAMQLAENAIKSGREMDIDTDSQNIAFQVLAEIAVNKERFQEIPESKIQEQKIAQKSLQEKKNQYEGSSRGKEAKKEKKSKARL